MIERLGKEQMKHLAGRGNFCKILIDGHIVIMELAQEQRLRLPVHEFDLV